MKRLECTICKEWKTFPDRQVVEKCWSCCSSDGLLLSEPIGPDRDVVNHPAHYNQGKIEVIEFIEDKSFGFHLGNAVKYIARAGKKDKNTYVEDLKKAIWYLRREIELQGFDPRRPNDMNLKEITSEAKKEVSEKSSRG